MKNNIKNNQFAIQSVTGKTRKAVEEMYLAAINTLIIDFGMQEPEARSIVRDSLKDALGLKIKG